MKQTLLLSVVLIFAASCFADTIINNFTGYNNGYYPFGDPNTATQTYGEIFTAPNGVSNISSFSFYMGGAAESGNIIMGAYLATWSGTHAAELLYSSNEINYDNVGNEEITLTGVNATVTPGQQYIAFLSTSQYHGQSVGEAYATTGSSNPNLNGFAYSNNLNGFGLLFTNPWNGYGLSPDWAVDLDFNSSPEPGTLVLLGTGVLGTAGLLRRKF